MKQINYKTITTVIIVVMLLTGVFYYVKNMNKDVIEIESTPPQKVEIFNSNTYYTEYYINVNNIEITDDLSDDTQCSLNYSLNMDFKEGSESLYDGLCSNMGDNGLVIDDKSDWGKVKDDTTVVDKVIDNNDTVYLFLSIVDETNVNEYVVKAIVVSLNYSITDNILRFEKDAEIAINSFDDVVLKVDNKVYMFEQV